MFGGMVSRSRFKVRLLSFVCLVSVSGSEAYRGTSLIRDTQPPRTTISP